MITEEEQDAFFKEELHADCQIGELYFLMNNIRQDLIFFNVEITYLIFYVKIDDAELEIL